jgi:hypothetical protein
MQLDGYIAVCYRSDELLSETAVIAGGVGAMA